jgi:SAM-dependent methyltransferase
MGFLNRLRVGPERGTFPAAQRTHAKAGAVALAEPASSPRTHRPSKSLKDFLWHIGGSSHGRLLDLGPVCQSTVNFFIERGFRVYTEDLLTAWKSYSQEESERQRTLTADDTRMTRAEIAGRFLEESLKFAPGSFDAVLAWDLLDYLEDDMMRRTADRIRSLLREGGVVLGMFHSRRPDQFQRYRVIDEGTLEVVPAPPIFPFARVFQNREISDLFSHFHTSKTFLGRDQLREALFVK